MVRYQGRHGISRSQRRSEETTQQWDSYPSFTYKRRHFVCPMLLVRSTFILLHFSPGVVGSHGMRKYRLEISPIPNYRLFSVLFPSSSTSCLSSSSSSEKQRRRVSRLSLSHLLTYSLTRARNRTNSFPSETTKGRLYWLYWCFDPRPTFRKPLSEAF